MAKKFMKNLALRIMRDEIGDDGLAVGIGNSHTFDVSNIETPKEFKSEMLDDFTLTPPYEEIWFERRFRGLSNQKITSGTLVFSERQPRVEDVAWKLAFLTFFKSGYENVVYMSNVVMRASLGRDGKFLFIDGNRQFFYSSVNEAERLGRITPNLRIASAFRALRLSFGEVTAETAKKMSDSELAAAEFMFSAINNSLFSLALLNTKNIEVIEHGAPGGGKKRRNRHKGIHHHTLRIRPGGRKSARDSQSTGNKNSFHFARGHFKTYTEENPLFGQHVGTYWWEAHTRGSRSRGSITKDYEVHPPIENKETTK